MLSPAELEAFKTKLDKIIKEVAGINQGDNSDGMDFIVNWVY